MEESAINSKNLGFSGDLLNVDSPRSNGSNGYGLSNRMAGLTNTQKQFIRRVDFDRNLQDIFARKVIHDTSDITAGFDSNMPSIPTARTNQNDMPFFSLDDSTGERTH